MKPKRIIEEPRVVKGKLLIKCDDGKIYTTEGLAKAVGLSKPGLYYRLQKIGWNHPDILDKKRRSGWYGPHRKYTKSGVAVESLGTNERRDKLAAIPEPTKFDRMFG